MRVVSRLLRAPRMTCLVVLTLSLGIGAVSALFAVVDAVLLHPLPYAHPDDLLFLETRTTAGQPLFASTSELRDLEAQSQALGDVAAYTHGVATLEAGERPVYVHLVRASGGFFPLFGVRPLLGRGLSRADESSSSYLAVLSYEVWQREFAASPGVIGRPIRLNGEYYTVVGVMPQGFRFPLADPDLVYAPLRASPEQQGSRSIRWLQLLARKDSRAGIDRVQADLTRLAQEWARSLPASNRGVSLRAMSLSSALLWGNQRQALWLAGATGMLLLLIAGANVTGILLADGLAREREVAVRLALGASRLTIAGQMLAEGAVRGLAAAAAGALLGFGAVDLLRPLLAATLERGDQVRIHPGFFAVSVAAAMLASLAAALLPAWIVSGSHPAGVLRSGPATGTGRGRSRLRAFFVISQIAMAMMLVGCAGVLIEELWSLRHAEMGFRSDHLVVLDLRAPRTGASGRNLMTSFWGPLLERIRRSPGVIAAGLNDGLPIANDITLGSIRLPGAPPHPSDDRQFALRSAVSPEWYSAMGVPLIRGRACDPGLDTTGSLPSAVVNRTFARTFFNGADPVNRRIVTESGTLRIVGEVGDSVQSVDQPITAEADSCLSQIPMPNAAQLTHLYLFVRSNLPSAAVARSLEQELHTMTPSLPLPVPETMEDVLDSATLFRRMLGEVLGLFAAVAVLLSVVGLYGMLSEELARGAREIAIRVALGAGRREIARGVVARVSRMLAAGILLGASGILLAHRILTSVMPISPARETPLILSLGLAVFLLGLLAGLRPIRYALAIDPVRALRSQ